MYEAKLYPETENPLYMRVPQKKQVYQYMSIRGWIEGEEIPFI